MPYKLMIDGTHSDELRACILRDDDRLMDYEVETSGKEQIKGNMYVGEVTRVEPSLQAAFINYGANRNGFLAFGEIHPEFFDLSDKERKELCKELEEVAARRRGEELDEEDSEGAEASGESQDDGEDDGMTEEDRRALAIANGMADEEGAPTLDPSKGKRPSRAEKTDEKPKRQPPIHRRYAIQDVVKPGQKILVQVVKEERGTKGAALTTYFSLPGRYTVLMPNTPYAGGISRKITNYDARKQLKEAIDSLKIPGEMGLIVRTAGVGVEKEKIQHDFKNLTSLWKKIQKDSKKGETAQCVHEDGSLVVRALRDMYNDEVEEIVISGKRAYNTAKDFAKVLMPDLAKIMSEYTDEETSLFSKYGIEKELMELYRPRVDLPSGGYIIINPTEALVSIDVNSGRNTGQRNLEETALKTNMEAADEVARQLKLRDLSGLIVVDFIDMEWRRNSINVERAMKKAVRKDRARIQVGNMSEFGLVEISRQRLRPSLAESTSTRCPHCHGAGTVPTLATSAWMIMRHLEDEEIRKNADRVIVSSSTDLVIYILNHKKDLIKELEARHKFQLLFRADDAYIAPDFKLDLVLVKADGSENVQTREVIIRENPDEVIETQRINMGSGKRPERDDRRDERKSSGRNRKDERDEGDDTQPRRGRNRRDDDSSSAKSGRDDRDDRKSAGRGGRRKSEDKDQDAEADARPVLPKAPMTKGRRPRRTGTPAPVLDDVEIDTETTTPTAETETKANAEAPEETPKPITRGGRRRMVKSQAAPVTPDEDMSGKTDVVEVTQPAVIEDEQATLPTVKRGRRPSLTERMKSLLKA